MSYQNGGHRVVMGGDPPNEFLRMKPMTYLEERRRRNRCLSLSLLAFFLAIIGSIAVWRIHEHTVVIKAVKASKDSDDDGVSDDEVVPPKGLVDLNKNINRQSQIIAEGCESTLLLMRHCEKNGPTELDDNGNEHCSYLGHERAHFLTSVFGSRWPNPSRLFALTPERDGHFNFREYETLQPLSVKSGIPIQIADQDDLASKYFELLRSGDMCGKLTVVSWKHSYIPELAQNLGCTEDDGCPKSYPEDSFDQVWQLKYVFHPEINEKLDEENQFMHNKTGRSLKGRSLQSKRSKKVIGWRLYATVSQQGFDPLSFSFKAGDYPDEGSPTGGKWKNEI